jgi:hypothetical protein
MNIIALKDCLLYAALLIEDGMGNPKDINGAEENRIRLCMNP